MIKKQDVDGKPATVAYLKADLTPVDNEDDAELLKVMFDNGDTAWLYPEDPEPTGEEEE